METFQAISLPLREPLDSEGLSTKALLQPERTALPTDEIINFHATLIDYKASCLTMRKFLLGFAAAPSKWVTKVERLHNLILSWLSALTLLPVVIIFHW